MAYGIGNGGDPMKSMRDVARNEWLTGLSRLVQLVGIPAGIGVMGWAVAGLISLQVDLGRINERGDAAARSIAMIQSSVDKINDLITARAPERYTKSDASRDFGLVGARLDNHDRRIEALENKIH